MDRLSQWAPRLVATDLDGTFLGPGSTVSQTNRRAVRAAHEAGAVVVFATGRPPTWMGPISDIGLDHVPVIGCNGAIRYDLATGEVHEVLDIAPDAIHRLGSGLRERLAGVSLGLQWADSFGYEPAYFGAEAPDLEGYFSGELDELVAHGPALKVLVQSWTTTLDDLVAAVQELAGNELSVTWSTHGAEVGERILLEVGARGVDKAGMLARHCAELGIDAEDVAAFGDMPNDLGMLTWAGRGYVVAPLHPVLADADCEVLAGDPTTAVGRRMLQWYADPTA